MQGAKVCYLLTSDYMATWIGPKDTLVRALPVSKVIIGQGGGTAFVNPAGKTGLRKMP